MLARNGEAVPLSEDHSTTRKDEIERVEQAGGRIVNNAGARVMGVLGMTRAIGDTWLRKYGVIPEPDVVVLDRIPQDEFVIMATDGLWGTVSSDEAVHITRRCLERAASRGISRHSAARIASKVLMRAAMHRGSKDNVTVIVFDLRTEEDDCLTGGKQQQEVVCTNDALNDEGFSESDASSEDLEDSPSPVGATLASSGPNTPLKGGSSPELQRMLDIRQAQEEQWGCILPRINMLSRSAHTAWPVLQSDTSSPRASLMTGRASCSSRLISSGEIVVKAIMPQRSQGPQLA